MLTASCLWVISPTLISPTLLSLTPTHPPLPLTLTLSLSPSHSAASYLHTAHLLCIGLTLLSSTPLCVPRKLGSPGRTMQSIFKHYEWFHWPTVTWTWLYSLLVQWLHCFIYPEEKHNNSTVKSHVQQDMWCYWDTTKQERVYYLTLYNFTVATGHTWAIFMYYENVHNYFWVWTKQSCLLPGLPKRARASHDLEQVTVGTLLRMPFRELRVYI